ncbi:hypothetical protein AG1IA_07265 [Rhizoctonia solani AG-1 IA]|uniref:Uncharacterized protein n=1 Tax=Thanatephorus cucumeris (strain AG1-IA) TaxID=983506 RepID=L8WL99_THACA|nr:hypothetical protein AG1IA_07265 [Rhizoctonia solani AG-1 IA]
MIERFRNSKSCSRLREVTHCCDRSLDCGILACHRSTVSITFRTEPMASRF